MYSSSEDHSGLCLHSCKVHSFLFSRSTPWLPISFRPFSDYTATHETPELTPWQSSPVVRFSRVWALPQPGVSSFVIWMFWLPIAWSVSPSYALEVASTVGYALWFRLWCHWRWIPSELPGCDPPDHRRSRSQLYWCTREVPLSCRNDIILSAHPSSEPC